MSSADTENWHVPTPGPCACPMSLASPVAHDEAADASCAQIEIFGSRPATTATGEQDESGGQKDGPGAAGAVGSPQQVTTHTAGLPKLSDHPKSPNPLNSFVTADSSAASRHPKQREDAAETAFGSAEGFQGAREQKGNDLLRNGEAALLRTREPVFEWGQALFHAKDYLLAATKEYRSGPAQLLRGKKPGLADFARRIKEAERQIEQQLQDDEDRHTDLIASGDWSAVISSMEHGWWLREELYGKGAPEVHDHVEELVLMLNNVAMHLVSIMSPEGNDGPAKFAWDYLCRALLLTEESSIQLPDAAVKKRLRAVTSNNIGCYFERRNKLLKSLEYLDQALRLELEAEYVQDPSATHLNLCRVLSRLQRHEVALQHARCATQILENDLIDLQEEWQRGRENMPVIEASQTTVHGTVTSSPPQTKVEGEERKKAEFPIEDRIKDAVAKFAVANYNAACVMEQMRCFDRALEFHRKAAEGARQAYGSDHQLTITFQQDLAHCSKIVRKHHSKRSASPSQSVQEPAERPPVYGLGFVAGPTTIVAGTRGSVRIGFQATIGRLNTAETTKRAAAKKRISLGKYSDGELRSMFDGNRASVLGTSVFSESSRVSREARDEKHEVSFGQEKSRSEISDDEDESRSADFRSIIADAIGAKKTLEPMVIQDEAGIAGFWVDRHNNTAYHVSKIGPVGSTSLAAKPGAKNIDTSADLRHLLVESSGLRGSAKEAEKSQWKNVLVADQALGGELPPMDPNRALEPERMNHLEHIASFLYEKAGPLPEFMVRLKLRVFDMHAWKTWKQRVCDEFWSEAKQMIQRTVIRNKSNAFEGGQDAPQSEAQLGARTAPLKAVNHDGDAVDETRDIPWQDSRMLFVKLSISFPDLKETIAAELGINADSVQIIARDLQENDYFCVASEHGLRSVFAACPGMHKSCEFFCSRAG